MQVLDYFANTGAIVERYRNTHSELQRAEAELLQMEQHIARSEGEREYKQFQFDKLQEAKLKEGELEELELEQKQLANSEQIREGLYGAVVLMQPMGTSIVQNLKDAVHLLQKSSNFVPSLEELCNRLESCRIECKDIEEELESLADKVVVSPQRLEQVDQRLSLLYSLMRKHSAGSVQELLQLKDSLEQELLGADRSLQDKVALEEKIASLRREREKLACELTDARGAKVASLGSVLQEQIRDLQMPHAIFQVRLADAGKYTMQGKDSVEFLFSANGSGKLNLLQKAASGGELSRIMLCIKSLMAQFTGMPTMIFDEIDTGVSGSIADKMGELIGKMGERMQIFAITHLPQIASKKGTHLLVYKEFDKDNNAATRIKRIEGQERENEVARMLSGSQLTKAALENARELLKENNK